MIKRTFMAGLATTALAATSLGLAAPALADQGRARTGAETCSITDILPQKTVIGIDPEGKRVQFGVETTCDDQDVKFSVRGAGLGTSAHAFWFAACNYEMRQGPTNYDCTQGGSDIIDPIPGSSRGYDFIPGNDLAGPNPIHAAAFVDANHNNLDDDGTHMTDLSETITLLRKTKFGNSFDASPEPVRKGRRISVSATLSTADWNTGTWATVDAKVKVQFKANGKDHYTTVKTVTATDGQLDTSVVAKRSGHWRVSYPGSGTTAASTSNSDYVKVRG